MIWTWQAREIEMDLYPCPITAAIWALLRNVGLLKYYEEDASLKEHSVLLVHIIRRWSAQEHACHVGLRVWYRPTKEDIYFITGLSRRGEYFHLFPDIPHGVAAKIQLAYTQRYVKPHVIRPSNFQVCGGQLCISSFAIEEVRCPSLFVTIIAHSSSDGKYISFPLLYYVDYFIQVSRCIKWFAIFLRQFCIF